MRTVLIGLLTAACVLGMVSPTSADLSPTGDRIDADPYRRCHGTVIYGASSIEVTRTRQVGCVRAKRLARAAVVYRVNAGFPTTFCRGGYCWKFGEPKGSGPGLSRIHFTGRNDDRRINAIQSVS
jgi:hypothetical protein